MPDVVELQPMRLNRAVEVGVKPVNRLCAMILDASGVVMGEIDISEVEW